MMQVKTGLESKCFVTLGITGREGRGRRVTVWALLKALSIEQTHGTKTIFALRSDKLIEKWQHQNEVPTKEPDNRRCQGSHLSLFLNAIQLMLKF